MRFCARRLAERAADAMIVTGDIAHDATEATYARVRAAIAAHYQVRSYGCRAITMWPRRSIGSAPRRRELQLGEWQIIAIDTHVDGAEGGNVGAAELDRLRDVLARTAARFVIVAGHHPPMPLGTPWLDNGSIANGAALLDLLSGRRAREGLRVRARAPGDRDDASRCARADDAVDLFSVRAGHRTLFGRRDAARMALARSRFRRYPHDPRGSRDRVCGDTRPFGIQENTPQLIPHPRRRTRQTHGGIEILG